MPTARAQQLANAVRKRRNELRLTQQDIVLAADRVGERISIQNVRVIEAGQRQNPTLEIAVALAKALRWPTDALNRIAMGEDPSEFETVLWDQRPVEGLGMLSPDEQEIWDLSLPEETRRSLIEHLRNGDTVSEAR